jgi:hypothetical protein
MHINVRLTEQVLKKMLQERGVFVFFHSQLLAKLFVSDYDLSVRLHIILTPLFLGCGCSRSLQVLAESCSAIQSADWLR